MSLVSISARTRRVILLAGTLFAIAILSLVLPTSQEAVGGVDRQQPGASQVTLAEDEVLVGVYVEDIQTIDQETNSFLADLYVWYRWRNPDFRPDKSVELMNLFEAWQLMQLSDTGDPQRQRDGSFYYSARFTAAFNSSLTLVKFPLGTQSLPIILEDFKAEESQMRFVADTKSTGINPAITLPGYQIGTPTIEISDYAYPTDFGDLDKVSGEVYSRATVSIPVSYPGLPNAVKYLVPIVLIVAAASLVFYLPPDAIEGRIALGITALLTLVAMQWSATEALPTVSYLTMLDVLYLLGVVFILASLVLGIRTVWMARDSGQESAVASDEHALLWFLGMFAAAFAAVIAGFLLR